MNVQIIVVLSRHSLERMLFQTTILLNEKALVRGLSVMLGRFCEFDVCSSASFWGLADLKLDSIAFIE